MERQCEGGNSGVKPMSVREKERRWTGRKVMGGESA